MFALIRHLPLAALLAASSLTPALAEESTDQPVFGWVEKAVVEPWGVEVKAKLDSGALTSSLDARDIERFEKNGEDWVRFRLELEDEDTGEMFDKTLERPVNRNLLLRGAGGTSRRPTVVMTICLGDTRYEEDFSLRDRSKMNYPVLLGRRTISHLGILDVDETFLSEPGCDDDSHTVPYADEK